MNRLILSKLSKFKGIKYYPKTLEYHNVWFIRPKQRFVLRHPYNGRLYSIQLKYPPILCKL